MRCHAINACQATFLRRDPQADRLVTPRDAALGASAKETLRDRTLVCALRWSKKKARGNHKIREGTDTRLRVRKRGRDTGEVRLLELYSSRRERARQETMQDHALFPAVAVKRGRRERATKQERRDERWPCVRARQGTSEKESLRHFGALFIAARTGG